MDGAFIATASKHFTRVYDAEAGKVEAEYVRGVGAAAELVEEGT